MNWGLIRTLRREISRASRAHKPLTLLLIEVDDVNDLYGHYGERCGQFVIKKVAERLFSNLRATDITARLGRSRFAVLLPVSGEMVSLDIAERMRNDIERFLLTTGAGRFLLVLIQARLGNLGAQPVSCGGYAAGDDELQVVGNKALDDVMARGGNCVGQSRLSTMVF